MDYEIGYDVECLVCEIWVGLGCGEDVYEEVLEGLVEFLLGFVGFWGLFLGGLFFGFCEGSGCLQSVVY